MGRGQGKGGCLLMTEMNELGGMLQAMALCVCLLLVLGPVLIIMGLSYLADATTDTRGEALELMGVAARAWEGEAGGGDGPGARADFAGLDLELHLVGAPQSPVPLPARSDGDAVPDIGSQDEDAPVTWRPLRYSAMARVAGSAAGDTYSVRDAGGAELKSVGPLFSCEAAVLEPRNCQNHPCSRRRRSSSGCDSTCCPCSHRCTEQGGSWVAASAGRPAICNVLLKLTEVSVLVPTGAGRLCDGALCDSNSWSDAGGIAFSLPDGNEQLSAEDRKAHDGFGTYEIDRTRSCAPGSGQLTPQITFTVRSADDPYVAAARDTGWTFDFGRTQGENARAGLLCLVFGLLLCAATVGAVWQLVKCARRNKAERVAPRVDYQMTQPAPQPRDYSGMGLAGTRFTEDDPHGYGPNAGVYTGGYVSAAAHVVSAFSSSQVSRKELLWQGAQRQAVAPTPVVMGQAAVPMAQPVMAQPVGAVAAHPVAGAAPGFIDQSVPAFAQPQGQGHQGP